MAPLKKKKKDKPRKFYSMKFSLPPVEMSFKTVKDIK